MHTLLAKLAHDIGFTGELSQDVESFLVSHGCLKTVDHSAAVAAEAQRIAVHVGDREDVAMQASWLHDISAVIPVAARVDAAVQCGIAVLPEEVRLPMILHQKLSVVLAREIFHVTDAAVLSAVGCHTTLKAQASAQDKIVFVADKLAWDQPGKPPYYDGMAEALKHSLDDAACYYLRYLWDRRVSLPVVHPWLVAACEDLCGCEHAVPAE